MNISKFNTPKLSFADKKPDTVIIKNPSEAEKALKLQQALNERLGSIINEIGGIKETSDTLGNIQTAQFKIGMLKQETIKAWGTCPTALKTKLAGLESLNNQLESMKDVINKINNEIDQPNKPPEIILPQSYKENSIILPESMKSEIAVPGNDKAENDTEKRLVSASEAMAAYNLIMTNSAGINANNLKTKSTKQLFPNALKPEELKNSLKELENDDWDFEKLNEQDSKIFTKLNKQQITGDIRETVENQVKIIDKKLIQLQNEKGISVPEIGMKVYTPGVTGKILALETAKLRRLIVQDSKNLPENIDEEMQNIIEKNLSTPDILAQPVPFSMPVFFKIDKSFIPTKPEFQEIMKLNEPYKPVLNKLFPEGLKVFMVPGYTADENTGIIEGGISLPGYPDKGIWLNSYDYNERYKYSTTMNYLMGKEHRISKAQGLTNIKPSVLPGNKDRGRALAHEAAHAIHYKLENNRLDSDNSSDISFTDGWKLLRSNTELNESIYKNRAIKINNSRLINENEMIAEDIRQALTEETIPASSAMTNIFDETKEGKAQLIKVKDYIRKCLLEDKLPTEVIFSQISGK